MDIQKNIINIRKQIYSSAIECFRSPYNIQLLAVTKTRSYTDILKAIEVGQLQFGESYVQEGLKKIRYFSYKKDLIWHFIGSLQSNKSRFIAEYFDWFHALDREKIARFLNNYRSGNKNKLNVLIQINIDDKSKKSGVLLEELDLLAEKVSLMPNLLLRGLMVIPSLERIYEDQCNVFRIAENAFKLLQENYSTVDSLSMGMSGDINAAIRCGSTIIRVGSSIFGNRSVYKKG
ncbi:UPF0001 protein YggS [Candidatus Providencia siddallii]|uniref:Pyridoxal phosphate homeostasis protein n=1 Tax=Candidatus Providencia siddallii TaxID=1715285 RepID=A0A0M6WAB3_9GAMM|nr:UPF0001 protein YggS [Candidatus Providencia siddallii]